MIASTTRRTNTFDVKATSYHTNTVEGYYSIFKRGMKGVYQHCSEKHLAPLSCGFDFRYSNRVALGVDDTARRPARSGRGRKAADLSKS